MWTPDVSKRQPVCASEGRETLPYSFRTAGRGPGSPPGDPRYKVRRFPGHDCWSTVLFARGLEMAEVMNFKKSFQPFPVIARKNQIDLPQPCLDRAGHALWRSHDV